MHRNNIWWADLISYELLGASAFPKADRPGHSAPPKLLRAGIPISSPPPPASQFLVHSRFVSIPIFSLSLPSPTSDPPISSPPPYSPRTRPKSIGPIPPYPLTPNASEEARRRRRLFKEAAAIAAIAARQIRYPPLLRAPDPGLPERQAPEARPPCASPSSSAAAREGALGGLAGGYQDAGAEACQIFSRNGER